MTCFCFFGGEFVSENKSLMMRTETESLNSIKKKRERETIPPLPTLDHEKTQSLHFTQALLRFDGDC